VSIPGPDCAGTRVSPPTTSSVDSANGKANRPADHDLNNHVRRAGCDRGATETCDGAHGTESRMDRRATRPNQVRCSCMNREYDRETRFRLRGWPGGDRPT